ncbi:HD family hydrolase [Pyrococcus sp. ST04]|uniref:HD domain-containing protein n=1 Tax=Pyrococcus sp. ST04 TaxID=1183377 RepID=UPI000A94C1B4|nr:HD family hydrolase [Pyrococcus sp. ST04]
MEILDKILRVSTLKRLPRMGWLFKDVPNPESIASHSFSVAFITLLLANELKRKGVNIDEGKAIKIAILHDIAESILTDLPLSAQKYLNKTEAEIKVFEDIFPEFLDLFVEYEEGKTLESQVVKLADKIDMVVQAYKYMLAGNRNLDEFWTALDEVEKLEVSKYFKDLLDALRRLKHV